MLRQLRRPLLFGCSRSNSGRRIRAPSMHATGAQAALVRAGHDKIAIGLAYAVVGSRRYPAHRRDKNTTSCSASKVLNHSAD